jgi:TM2 domain-containing membrane protein YozV
MSAAVCPYCRGPIEPSTDEQLVCSGCGTPHHSDCYAENAGCTVFGCSKAPAEEPKLSLSTSDLAKVTRPPAVPSSTTLGLETRQSAPNAPPVRVKAPPPPMPSGTGATESPAQVAQLPRFGVGSVLFGSQPVAAAAVSPAAAADFDFEFEPDPEAKNRTTFIVLGALLGPCGAHNFYAGYKGKGIAQLCITVLTLGFASPMSWIWAVIDVCTVDRDSKGIKFKS